MDINFWGTLNVMKHLMPLIRSNGRVVIRSSASGVTALSQFKNRQQNMVAKEIYRLNRSLTLERLEQLAQKYVQDCKDEINLVGWPNNPYGISKTFVNCITRIYA